MHVKLHSSKNISVGGLSCDVTDSCHLTFKNLFFKISKKLGLLQAGVDLLCEDLSKDINTQKWYIIDWNIGVGTRGHQNPYSGQPRNIYRAIFGAFFPSLRSHPLFNSNGGPAPNPLTKDS